MKISLYIILIFAILISFQKAFSQEKFSDNLIKISNNKGLNDTLTVWIFFKDKGENLKEKISEIENKLPINSLKRRAKTFPFQTNYSTFYDIPVNENYISSITNHLIKTRRISLWLNAISGDILISELYNLSAIPFISKIDIVLKSKINYSENLLQNNEMYFTKSSNYSLNYGNSLLQCEQINVTALHDSGFNGSEINICVMDAGFNYLEHPAFQNIKIIDSYDFVNNDNNVDDETDFGSGSHGTKTLSVLAAFDNKNMIGPAYGASFILAKTENSETETQIEEDNWIAAMEWAEYKYGIDISSTSLGYTFFDNGEGYDITELDGNTSVITKGAQIAASLGILVVNSAGNEGFGITTIMAPSDGDSVLAVGAVTADEIRSYFSSTGPTSDGRIKPDVMALGTNVYVASSVSPDYAYSSGTSFSCPLVAGAAALLMQKNPSVTNMDIFNSLKNTASNSQNPNNEYGWGIINTLEADKFINTSIKAVNGNEIIIFPNPASFGVNIFNLSTQNTVKIYNLAGIKIMEINNINSNFLNLYFLKSGIYIFKIYSDNNIYIKKIVKIE
jgi:subtilisin family serine protease